MISLVKFACSIWADKNFSSRKSDTQKCSNDWVDSNVCTRNLRNYHEAHKDREGRDIVDRSQNLDGESQLSSEAARRDNDDDDDRPTRQANQKQPQILAKSRLDRLYFHVREFSGFPDLSRSFFYIFSPIFVPHFCSNPTCTFIAKTRLFVCANVTPYVCAKGKVNARSSIEEFLWSWNFCARQSYTFSTYSAILIRSAIIMPVLSLNRKIILPSIPVDKQQKFQVSCVPNS